MPRLILPLSPKAFYRSSTYSPESKLPRQTRISDYNSQCPYCLGPPTPIDRGPFYVSQERCQHQTSTSEFGFHPSLGECAAKVHSFGIRSLTLLFLFHKDQNEGQQSLLATLLGTIGIRWVYIPDNSEYDVISLSNMNFLMIHRSCYKDPRIVPWYAKTSDAESKDESGRIHTKPAGLHEKKKKKELGTNRFDQTR